MKKKLKIWIDGKRVRGTFRCDEYSRRYTECDSVGISLIKKEQRPSEVPNLSKMFPVEIGFIHGKNIIIIEK